MWLKDVPEQCFDEYMKFLLDGIKPFSENHLFFTAPEKREPPNILEQTRQKYIVNGIENAISEIGFAAECHAFRMFNKRSMASEEMLSYWGNRHSLETLLTKCQKHLEPYMKEIGCSVDLYEIMAVIVQDMDLGLLGMRPVRDRHQCENNLEYSQQKIEIYTELHAGEATLFILFERYSRFIPVLDAIMKWRGNRFPEAELAISRLVTADWKDKGSGSVESAELCIHSLSWLYQQVYWSGHRFSEWIGEKDGDPSLLNIFQHL